jgi:hypothetical protein
MLPSDLGLSGSLFRASLDLDSAMYPCYHKPPVLLWLFLDFLGLFLELQTLGLCQVKPACIEFYILYITFIHSFAGTASFVWWHVKTAGFLLRGINSQMEALY